MPFTPTDPQYLFAQADLASHQSAAWRIVALQRPPYSSSSASSSSIPVRTYLVPLFQQQNVQLVLSGNSHNYERTVPMKNGAAAAGGVTYIVSGNGGNGFNAFTVAQPSYTAFRQATTYGYLRIDVNVSALTVSEVRSDTGTIIDSTTINGSVDTTKPSTPANLIVTGSTSSNVSLSWDPSTDNVGVTGYNVYRNGVAVASGVTGTTYTDSGLTPSTTYQYTVTAMDAAANESSPQATPTPGITTAVTHVPIFSDGFESGNLSAWSTFGGLTIDGTNPHAGGFSAHASVTPAYAKKVLPTTYADGYFRTYFLLGSGYATQVNVMRYRTSADGSLGYLYVTPTGTLGMRNDVGAVNTATTTSVSSGTWHSLEFHLTVAGTASATEVWLDGVLVPALSLSGQNWGTTNIGKVQIGEVAAGKSYSLTFDDVALDSQQIGHSRKQSTADAARSGADRLAVGDLGGPAAQGKREV